MEYANIDQASAMLSRASFTCEPKAIADAAAYLAKRIIERRNTIPILSYVRIAADLRGTVTLTGTDLDIEASITIAAQVEAPGTFCADATVLADVLAKARKEKAIWEVRIADNDGRAIIKAGRGRFNVPTLPFDGFPAIMWGNTLSAFTMPAAQFIGDLAALSPCMLSGSEPRYYLKGVALQVRDMAGRDSLVAVATDGHQMGIASRPIPVGAGDIADCIVPSGAVAALIAARKLYDLSDTLSVESDGSRIRVDLGDFTLTTKLIDGTFPDWTRVWGADGPLSPIEAQEALFPDLLPGAPATMLEKVAKWFKGALSWSPAREGQLGSVAGDPGLLFGVLNLKDDGGCSKKGFSFKSEHGEGEITGPDGLTYPVAFSDRAISLSAAQVRALIGDSCFETMAVTIAGRVLYILAWLWNDGASRFLTVAPNGRTWAQGEYVTRAQIEAAIAGEIDTAEAMPEFASQSGAGDAIEPCAALDSGEAVGALTGPEIGSTVIAGESHNSDPDPIAALVARIEALETALRYVRPALQPSQAINASELADLDDMLAAPLSAEAGPPPTVAKRTPAHERAVRRAWAERKARRKQVAGLREGIAFERHAFECERDRAGNLADQVHKLQGQLASTQSAFEQWHKEGLAGYEQARILRAKRRRSTMLARDLQNRLNAEYRFADKRSAANRERIDELKRERDFERARADTLHAQLAKIAADTADFRERARPGLSRLLGGASPVALRVVA